MWSLQYAWALLVLLLPSPCTAKRVTSLDLARQGDNFTPSALSGFSQHRRSCLAQDDLDSKVCPPERCTADVFSIRMALAGLPIGDAYIALTTLQVLSGQLRVIVKRKSDTSFSFVVAGAEEGQAMGNATLWYDGLQFLLPHTSIGQHAKNVASLESFLFGWTKEDYGRLDQGKVFVEFNMSADFQLNGLQWELVKGTEKQKVNIKAGAGGFIMSVANLVIEKLGGIDVMFFNLVWPQLQKLIPEVLGTAFQEVPHYDGELSNQIILFAKCPEISGGKTCPSNELDVTGTVNVSAKTNPIPILRKLEGWPAMEGFLANMTHNLVDAYDKGQTQLLQNWKSKVSAHALLQRNKATHSTVVPDAKLPLNFLKAILPNVSLYDFVPSNGALGGAGEAKIANGVIEVPYMKVSGVTLPVGKEFATVSATVRDVKIEVESGVEDDDFLFGSKSPLSFDVPGIKFKFGCGPGCDKDGLTLTTSPDTSVDVTSSYIHGILDGLRGIMRSPSNVRQGSDLSASGVVPKEFLSTPARLPAFLELNDIVQKTTVDVEASATTLENEQFEIKTDVALVSRVKFGKPFWRGVLDNSDADWGYLQMTMLGRVGAKKTDTDPPKEPAILRLVCGSVRVWRATKEPFQKAPSFEFDLGHPAHVEQLQNVVKKSLGWHCLLMKGHMFNNDYFCAPPDKMDRLQHAMRIQVTRIYDASGRWKDACYWSADGKKEICEAKPDGTWFREKQPYWPETFQPQLQPPSSQNEVRSPMQLWTSALKGE